MTQRRMLWWMLGVCLVLWFVLMGWRDLIDPDEGRYAEIPREMVVSGDWVTPRLQGFKYFEKPALQYWLTAAAYSAFGISTVTARLATVTAGFACMLWIGFVAWQLYGARSGFYSLLVCCSSLLFFVMGHYLTLDMMLTLWMSVAMGSLMLAQHASRPQHTHHYMLLAWAALGLGMLSKGLVALVLPAASLALYTLWQRDWALWRRLYLGRGLFLMLAITAPWFVVVSRRNPEFASFFFVHEHFARFTTAVHHREQAWYYMLSVFLLGSAPWLVGSAVALVKPDFAPCREHQRSSFNAARLAWVYVTFILVFYSLSHSQLASYVLPAMPFVALLVARRLDRQPSLLPDALAAILFGVVLIVAAVVLPHFASRDAKHDLLLDYRPYIAFAGCALVAGGVVLSRLQRLLAVAIMALMSMVAAQSLLLGYQSLAPSRSSRVIADQIRAMQLPQNIPLYLVGHHSPSLSFYLQRVPVNALNVGELAMGIASEPEQSLQTVPQFVQRWHSETQAVAVVSNGDMKRFVAEQLPMRIVYRSPRSTIILKQ